MHACAVSTSLGRADWQPFQLSTKLPRDGHSPTVNLRTITIVVPQFGHSQVDGSGKGAEVWALWLEPGLLRTRGRV